MKKYEKRILLFLLVSLLIVTGSFSVLFLNFKKQSNLQKKILHIENNLIQVDSLTSSLLRLESHKRGYQLTADSGYLANFNSEKVNARSSIRNLQANTQEPELAGRIVQIDSMIARKIKNLDSGIFLFRTEGPVAAMNLMQHKEVKSIRERLDTEVGMLKIKYLQELNDSSAGISKRTIRNVAGLLIILAVFILLMMIAAITFRKAQKRLIKNHSKFKEAQRIAKIGSWEWDITTGKLKWSQEQFRIFGQERGMFELSFDNYLALLPGNERDKTKQKINEALGGGTAYENEYEIVRKDGSRLTLFEQGTVLYDNKGKPTAMFGTTQDVTEIKRAEKALLTMQKKLRSMFDNSADGIYQSTFDGKFIMVNSSMARIFGYDSPEELLQSVSDIGKQLYVDENDRVQLSGLLALKGHAENYELQVRKKNGEPIWVSLNIRIAIDEKTGFRYFEGMLEDISERRRAEEEILQLNKSLEQFANITAHDLQEPIRMVSGFLGLLEKRYDDVLDEQGRSYIYRAKDGADRMSILIKDLLEFSRSGNKAAKKEAVNLESVLDLVNRDMSIVINDTSADVHIPASLPVVSGTQSALYRLFLNLVSNGIKFRKKDTAPEVMIDMKELDDSWEFTVQDNGIGVAEKDQAKLFQPFQRLHRKEDYPGTGLGLVTCKKIVETHGGRIWLTSEQGKGTGIHFTIPKMRA